MRNHMRLNGIETHKTSGTRNPMGATKTEGLKLSFDRRLTLEFHGANISSDAGLLAYREMDDVLGLTAMSGHLLNDWRTGRNTQHSMLALIRHHDGPGHAAKVTSGSKTEPISTSFTRTSPQPAQIMNSNGKSRLRMARLLPRRRRA